jgi:hypothetical protein
MPLFTALHRLLGRDPGPITDELIDAAVAAGLRETSDLDWKDRLPPQKGLTETDFPKDVAAMANCGGGVLVYGVQEAEKVATARSDAGEVDEHWERALQAAAVSAIRPPVLGLDIHTVGEVGARAVVVIVPATTEGPHLIFRNQFFGAPIRNDADTAWMTERQIESAYRTRLEERRRAAEALTDLYDEAETNWTTGAQAWLIAVAHPRLPVTATTRPTREDAAAMFAAAVPDALLWASRAGIHPLENVDRLNPRPGLRRWIAVNERNDKRSEWRSAWAALHHDGSVSLAASIGGHRDGQDSTASPNTVDGGAIECAIADFMALIRAASAHLHTGEYDVRVGIEGGYDFGISGPILIRGTDNFGHPFDGNSLELHRYSPVDLTVVADASALDYYWQVHDLARDCINQGGLTHVRLIRPPEREA